ncbi:metallophosphoesterase family protein [Alkalithermobacter paradoxus]|uniref:Phosphoesterase n=1 Tax=Alkalithermobacter paradoxus TaxID=29349 RepID=A0A1V4I8Q9_9FIRM|nr:hypothetical protein CLOTH_07130 [[Clostridium] thermoalcaliphilum]
MKVGILGDTHKNMRYIDEAIQYLKECDLILHTGDNFIDSKYIYKMTGVQTLGVAGNCDFEDVEDEILFNIKGYNVYLCHGHKHYVNSGIERIKQKAKDIGANIVVFGHTHEYMNHTEDDILFLNPASITSPRGGSKRGFIIMDIESESVKVNKIIL